jgi:alpha-tubulin suppressor-like RCC1 family protein
VIGTTSALVRRLATGLVPGLLLAVVSCGENAESPTAPDGKPNLDKGSAAALSLRQVSVTWFHTCGVTTTNVAYCWGENRHGQLGNGTTNDSPRPVRVGGGLFFRQVTTGSSYSCGLATDDLTYCWGENNVGQLGDGTTIQRLTPTRVRAGTLRFRRVTAGSSHTCGETGTNLAYCWGYNDQGQLGIGTNTGPQMCGEFACSTRPVAVTGGRRFSQLSASSLHTCGVTPFNIAFCWGDNRGGQLGTGSTSGPETCRFAVCSTKPVKVVGGLLFRQIDGGGFHTCGVTTDFKPYCWGENNQGRLGNGTFSQPSLTPSRVRGGIFFRMVSAGGFSSCGITPENVAYCWGRGVPLATAQPATNGPRFRSLAGSTSGKWMWVPILEPAP